MKHRPGRTAARGGLAAVAAVCLTPLFASAAIAAELVMFDGKWCARCKQFLAEVAPVYHTTPPGKAMPLRVVEHSQVQPWFRVSTPIEGTPTFVLVDKGQELGRIVGYTSREAFIAQAYQLMGVLQQARTPTPRKRLQRTREMHVEAGSGTVRR